MESLAYWIHSHPEGNTGDSEGGTLIDKDELIQKLSQDIKTLKGIKLYEAKEEAKRFVDHIKDRSGLLNEQGQDCYAFVHKTFQEYLCAQEINYQAENEGDFDIVLNHITDHLHQQHWREVLLLLIAQQNHESAVKAIRKVLDANSPYEQWLHRDVLFAGQCLTEDPKKLQVAAPNLSSEILTMLITSQVKGKNKVGEKVDYFVSQILSNLSKTTFANEALKILKTVETDVEKFRFLKYQVDLGNKRKLELIYYCCFKT